MGVSKRLLVLLFSQEARAPGPTRLSSHPRRATSPCRGRPGLASPTPVGLASPAPFGLASHTPVGGASPTHFVFRRLVVWPASSPGRRSSPRWPLVPPLPRLVLLPPRLVGLRVSPPPRPLVYSKPSTLFSCIPSSLFSPTHLTPNSLPPLPPSSYLHTHLLVVLFVYFSSYRAN